MPCNKEREHLDPLLFSCIQKETSLQYTQNQSREATIVKLELPRVRRWWPASESNNAGQKTAALQPIPPAQQPEQEKKVSPLKFPFFWSYAKCFVPTKRQTRWLTANLPQRHINALQAHSFFTEWMQGVQGVDVYVDFTIAVSRGKPSPYVRIRIGANSRGTALSFNISGIDDPVSALVVLWLMFKKCPLAFLLVPCNYHSYAHHIVPSQEWIGCLKRRTTGYQGLVDCFNAREKGGE